ncbi:spinster family MFS transporter [Sphingorhabdus sp. 109]|jgi:MFS family permease|uniref:spinster family MFS transporter n=1 Tax=Sphingorhabdus sp. 109 TaxID=2653173 RepID=UPI0012F10536|nr:MFS transporter [Sphingorhabdus sp. 109]VWX62059.1 Predicted arabinose efflux permease, MFS family [Sphingorhabdus sp. 109]
MKFHQQNPSDTRTGCSSPAASSLPNKVIPPISSLPAETLDIAKNKRPNYVLTVLFLVTMLNFVDRQMISILAEAIKRDMGLSDSQIGLMTGLSFALFYTTLAIPVAALADRWNRSRIIAIAISIWSFMTILCGVAVNFVQLFVARIGVGVGEAGSSPASHSLIADLFPPERRAGALGILGMSVPIGSFIAYTGGGWMVENIGWRMAFVIAGIPGLFIAALMWFTVPDPRGKPRLADAFKPKESETSLRTAISELSRKPAYWHLVGAGIIISFVSYGLASFYAGLFVRVHGIGYTELGWKLGVMVAISGSGGAWIGGKVGDYLNVRMPAGSLLASAVILLAATPGMYFAIYAPSANIAFLLLAIPTFAFTFNYGPNFSTIQLLASDQTRALAMAIWLLFAGLFGLGLGPVFVGVVSDIFSGGAAEVEASSLQKALAILALFNIWGAFHFWRAQIRMKATLTKSDPDRPFQR